ncbi:hypothetical protein [Pararhizobium sp.]|uniref:hypothetical protein n=1 Tax=Pararhizobium sp. TaxID=1977563 RepID=UPI00271FE10F|nr:hypothetical protein [Pararhizobium sp.]MDO9417959.1 hypothetical protein [Pararhizobium sp.]
MNQIKISDALLSTLPRLMARADPARVHQFESGHGTKPATKAYVRQSASLYADRVVTRARKQRPTSEQRAKEVRRRRSWGGGGNMPARVRENYTEAERAALSVIADQFKKKGFCDLCLDEIGNLAGVKRTSVQNALRKATSKGLAHLSVRERRPVHGKSLTNLIKIVCSEWLGWIARGIGFKRLNTSKTEARNSLSESADTVEVAFERDCAAPQRQGFWLFKAGKGRSNSWRSADDAGIGALVVPHTGRFGR